MIPGDSVVRHVLSNGLTVLMRRDTSAPVGAVVTYIKAGYFDETDDVVGIAHVLEHMYFKGTPSRGVGQIARETKASGGYLNAHTIYDHTSYYAVLPSDGFDRGLAIQADAYANSLIDADELRKELEVIIQEARRKADSPGAVAMETLFELLHDCHRIRRWRIGREPGLRALTRERVAGFYRNFYQPGNTLLVVVGDVDVDTTLAQIETRYGTLPAGVVRRVPGERESRLPGFRFRELTGDVKQTQIAMGWRTPGSLDPDTVPLDLFGSVLGLGRASRLYRTVRERQLASSVFADNYTPTEIGVFMLGAEGPPARTREAAAAMWGEMAAARDAGISPAEVERAQRLFESRWLRRLETMEGQATFLAEWESLGDWRRSEDYFARAMAATAAGIVDAARRWLAPDQASLLVYRPATAPSFAAGPDDARGVLAARPPGAAGPPMAQVEEGPPAAVTARVQLERIDGSVFVYRAGSGLPILVRQRRGAPIVHLGVYTAAGAAGEPDATAGVATLTARAMLKGTARRSAEEIAYASELLGGSISPSVTSDGLGWTLSVPVTRVEQAVELLADIVQHPRLDEESVDTERVIACANLAELRDDMYRYPVRLVTAAAYGGHPYGRGILGSEETLHAVGVDDVRRWHGEQVLHSPAVLAVAGDVEDSPIAALLASAFHELTVASPVPMAAPRWPSRTVELAETRERAQTALAMAFQGPARRDDERFAAHLIAGVTSGLGGRFFDVLRDARSLAYTVHAYAMERVHSGAFLAYIATSPEREDEARAGLLAEFARLREEPVTSDELERAQIYALGSHAIAQQSGGVVLGEVLDAWLFGSGLDELDLFETRVRGVTAEAMRRLAERYFDPERRAEGIVRGHAPSA